MRNRTCVITGASRGIGRGIAKRLGRERANVVVNYRSSESKAEEVAEKIESYGGQALTVQADVREKDEIQELREKTHEEFGLANVLVNNAGINQDVLFEDMSHDQWKLVLDVHLDGAFNCTQAFYEDLKEVNHGRLINISSIVGQVGNMGQANYSTAKSGIHGFTRTIARELAPHGSTANVVSPGFIETSMLDGVPEEILDQIREDTPLGRVGEVDEIASVVAFLASEESSFMTGTILDVNGGKHL